MSSATANRSDVPTIGWMLGMSSWMLLTAIPGSWTAWLGFMIVGVVGRMPRWAVAGGALGVAAIVAALPVWGPYARVATSAVYIIGMLLALAANPQWLRNRWAARSGATAPAAPAPVTRAERRRRQQQRERERRREAAQRKAEASRPSSSSRRPTEAEELASEVGATTKDYFSTPAAKAEPVDVNTADANALSGLPGMSRSKARQMVRRRDKQNGFATLDAFAAAAGLQPHEIVRLRTAAVCSPPPRGPRSFGRRVDY